MGSGQPAAAPCLRISLCLRKLSLKLRGSEGAVKSAKEMCHSMAMSSYMFDLIRPVLQARPEELAKQLPGRDLHMKSLANGLKYAKHGILYTLHALQRWPEEWPETVADTVARELSSATMFLAGLLDGMVMVAQHEPKRSMSFYRTPFQTAELGKLQDCVKGLRSCAKKGQALHADFWTVADFWKHCLPYQPLPSLFVTSGRHKVVDFGVALSEGCTSGPVMHDLIVPTYNHACRIWQALANDLGMDTSTCHLPSEIDVVVIAPPM